MINVGFGLGGESESIKTKPGARGEEEYDVYNEYIKYLMGSEGQTQKRKDKQAELDAMTTGRSALKKYIDSLSNNTNFQGRVDQMLSSVPGMTNDEAIAAVLKTMGLENIGSQLANYDSEIARLELELDSIPPGGGEKTPSFLESLTSDTEPYLKDAQYINDEYKRLQKEVAAGNTEALGQMRGNVNTQDAMMGAIFNPDTYKPLNLGSFQGQELGQMFPHYKKAQEIQTNKQGILNDILSGNNLNATTQQGILKDLEAVAAAEANAKSMPLMAYLQQLQDLHFLNEQMRYKVGTQKTGTMKMGVGVGFGMGGQGGQSTTTPSAGG